MISDLLLRVEKEWFERRKIITGVHKPQSWEEKLGKVYLQTIHCSTLYCKVQTNQGTNQKAP